MPTFTLTSIFAVFVFVSTAVARFGSGNTIAGAAYFITNDPSGNKVVSVGISSNGQLGSTVRAFSTQGRGQHGNATGTDALFSQGSVAVNTKAKLLATVNAGSDTVSLFSINSEDPTRLTLLGRPIPSGGEFPQSVAINSKGTNVCVLNGGKVNGVNCFTTHPVFGLLPRENSIRLLNRNQTTPPSGPAGSLGSIIFSPDDSKVIATAKGVPPTPGFIASWTIGFDGSLSSQYVKSTPAAGGALPFSLTPIPGTNAILATDPALGFDIFNFGGSGGRSGELEPAAATATTVPGQAAICWSTYSPKSGNFYLIDTGTSIVTEVHLDKNLKATLVKQYQLASGSSILDSEVATVGHNDFLYILGAKVASIDVLSVNTPGKATVVQTFAFTSAVKQAGATFTNLNLQGMATYIKS